MRYFAFKVGAAKDLGAAIGVAINGINIQVKFIKGISPHCQGPNDAGDVSIDEGGFQLACQPTHHQLGCKLAKINLQVMSTLPANPNDTRNPNDLTEGSCLFTITTSRLSAFRLLR